MTGPQPSTVGQTLQLLRIIGSPLAPAIESAEAIESQELYRYAFKNRVGLLYLLAVQQQERLDLLTEEFAQLDHRARETLVTVTRVADVFAQASIPYVLVKTLRPYPTTPNDVDIVFLGDNRDFPTAIEVLKRAGYQAQTDPAPLQMLFVDPRGSEVGNWEKRGGIYYVDLYKEMATDYFIYVPKHELRKHVIEVEVLGTTRVDVLRPEVELAAILMHSVFPENTCALEIFYTTCYALARFGEGEFRRFIAFVRRNRSVRAVRASLSIVAALHERAFGFAPEILSGLLDNLGGVVSTEKACLSNHAFRMPHKFTGRTFLGSFAEKATEPVAAASLCVQAWHMLNPRFAREAMTSLHRKYKQETYVQV